MLNIFFECLTDELLLCLQKSTYVNKGVPHTHGFARRNTCVIKKLIL